jgi:polyketide synthase PksN
MAQRLALVVSSLGELREYLSAYCQEKKAIPPGHLYEGRVETDNDYSAPSSPDEDDREFIRKAIEKRNVKKIARFWVSGLNIEWQLLYPSHLPQRISLPTYPFEKRRYWFDSFQARSEKRSNQPEKIEEPMVSDQSPVPPESQKIGKVVLKPRQTRFDSSTRPADSTDETEVEQVLPTVTGIVGNVLHVPACELDLELPFRELGVDSINGVEIIRGINKAFHLDLAAISLYDYSNVTALARHVSRESGKNRGGEEEVEAGSKVTLRVPDPPPDESPDIRANSEPPTDNDEAGDIVDSDYRITRLLTRLQEGELDDDQVRKQLEAMP